MRKVVHLDHAFIDRLVERRIANNRIPLMNDFGISHKTWQKIRMASRSAPRSLHA